MDRASLVRPRAIPIWARLEPCVLIYGPRLDSFVESPKPDLTRLRDTFEAKARHFFFTDMSARTLALPHAHNNQVEWLVGDGKKISLWHECWMGELPIANYFPNFIFPPQDKLSSLINNVSGHIPDYLPNIIKYYLSNALLDKPSPRNCQDSISWKGSSNGELSIKQAWSITRTRSLCKFLSYLVWSSAMNPRISCFAWRLLENLQQNNGLNRLV